MLCQDFVNLHSCASTCAQIQYYQIKLDFLLLGLWLTGLAIRIMSQKRNIFYALVYQSLESVPVSPVIMSCTNIQTRLFQFPQPILAVLVPMEWWEFYPYNQLFRFPVLSISHQLFIGNFWMEIDLSDLVFGPQERNQPWEIR